MSVYGLLGRHLAHSYSPMIHEMMADYTYKLFEVEPEKLSDFLREEAFDGINVTIPYKQAVIPFCDEISIQAASIGSVNTILRRADGTLFGDNTDAYGFLRMVQRSGIMVEGKKVLVLGSGGASLTVCNVLQDLKAKAVVVISRTGEHHYGNIENHSDAEIIVNTTPVGMYPNVGEAPVDLSYFPHLVGVLDLIYNPARTKFALDAEARGISYETGLSMLVGQAKKAVELFAKKTVSEETEEQVHSRLTETMQNIILIGMPGCGKSTIGPALTEKMGKQFVDADEVLVSKADMYIPEIFEVEGETGFRRRETEVLSELGKQSGLVIATGGGCVTKKENYAPLHQNGIIVWIQREVSKLPTEGRPISKTENLQELYEKRKPLYASFADVSVVNDGKIDEVCQRIWEAVHEIIGD